MKHISSRDNPLYKQLRQLLSSAAQRKRAGAMVLEGVHLAQAWLAAGGEAQQCVMAEEGFADAEIAQLLERIPGERVAVLPEALYRGLSLLDQDASMLLLADQPAAEMPARIAQDCVILDRVQDAGNAGSILRTAAAAGVELALCVAGTASAWSPKTLRAGMGAQFRMQVVEGLDAAGVLERLDVRLLAAAPGAAQTIFQADLRAPAAWVFGNEGQRLDPAWLDAAQGLAIPQTERVESLNVAAAAAICLFETRRQRLA
ncbi:MAG: RNA methyltransferase [Candidatus Protistobacter heckmanni]|nr:RNA methyltransferase [Candidatus Protistobacter heckmanni]